MLSVTKRFEFEAAHHLPDYDGICQNLHGHSYKLEVEVGLQSFQGLSKTGIIIDFKLLKEIVNEKVISVYDHEDLNEHFDNPTAENMVVWISHILWHEFKNHNIELIKVNLYETSNSYVTWKRN